MGLVWESLSPDLPRSLSTPEPGLTNFITLNSLLAIATMQVVVDRNSGATAMKFASVGTATVGQRRVPKIEWGTPSHSGILKGYVYTMGATAAQLQLC